MLSKGCKQGTKRVEALSKVGQEIRRTRRGRKLSQARLGEETGLDSSTISRIESGVIPDPSAEHLEKIAKALEIDLAKLNELRSLELEEAAPLRIAVTHSIWSAPVIALVMEYGNLFPEIEFASYCTSEAPIWIGQNTQISTREESGPPNPSSLAFSELLGVEIPGYRPTLTAKEAQELMTDKLQSENRADCSVAASEALESDEDFSPCIQIAHVNGGCSLLAIVKEKKIPDETYTLTQLLKTVADITPKSVPVIYARSTIATSHFAVLNEYKIDAVSFEPIEVNLGDWKTLLAAICDHLHRSPILLVLAWHPQVSWVKSLFNSSEAKDRFGKVNFYERSLGLLLSNELTTNEKSKNSSPPSIPDFTHDLIFNGESERWKEFVQSGSLKRLFSYLDRSVRRINEARTSGDPIVLKIANYLGMEPDECLGALRACGFSLLYHPDYLSFLEELD